ncbi:MAG: hypothetical protein K6B74_10100 [Ruminococcus sp.]|nr:hypothetical protein [Ruminococcus sp.]
MKRNRALAFLAALTLCTATACGEIGEETPAAAVTDTAETVITESSSEAETADSSSETITTDISSVDPVAETTIKETKTEAPASDDKIHINDDNCIIINDSDLTFDKETLYRMTELAAEQYNAVIDSDKQRYFDTVNFPALLKSEGMINTLTSGDFDFDAPEEGLYVLALLACDESVLEDKKELFENKPDDMNDETYKLKLREALDDSAEKLTIEDTSILFDNDSSPFAYFIKRKEKYGYDAEELKLSDGDGAVYSVDIEEYSTNDIGSYAMFYVTVYKGKIKAELDQCIVGIYDSGSSVLISNIYIKNAPNENMTAEEIRRDSEHLFRLDEMNTAAKVAYNAAAEYIADCECKGISENEVFENGSFKQAASEKGLPLDGNSFGAEGDAALAKTLKDCGFTDGFVYIGRAEINGKDTFYLQFRAQEGGYIGQYPAKITAERAERAEWRTYLPKN